MSNKKQTALEWYIEEIDKYNKEPWKYVTIGNKQAIIDKAKEMYKQEMIDFGFDTYCFISGIMKVPFEQLSENRLNAEHNYNETYEQ